MDQLTRTKTDNASNICIKTDRSYNTIISKLQLKLFGHWRFLLVRWSRKGQRLSQKGPKCWPKWSQKGAKWRPECHKNRSKTMLGPQIGPPLQNHNFGIIFGCIRGCSRVHFCTNICQSSIEKQSKNRPKKWCRKNLHFNWKIIPNVCQNWLKSGTKMSNKSELAISLFLQRV